MPLNLYFLYIHLLFILLLSLLYTFFILVDVFLFLFSFSFFPSLFPGTAGGNPLPVGNIPPHPPPTHLRGGVRLSQVHGLCLARGFL